MMHVVDETKELEALLTSRNEKVAMLRQTYK